MNITNLNTVVTPQDFVASRRNALITGILFALHIHGNQFYGGPKGDAPQTEAAQRAELQFNDSKSDVFGSAQFKATIQALTGETIRWFGDVSTWTPKVGMVVTPVVPAHRERTDDGYAVGVNYLVTNETTGRGRGADNLDKEYLNSSHGYGVQPMSRLNDEWALVTDRAAIEALVDLLIEKFGIKFIDSMLSDDGKSLLPYLEKIAE